MTTLQVEAPERLAEEVEPNRRARLHLLEEQQREDIRWALASKVETPSGKRSPTDS
jgi:hypothetical protein